MSEAGFDNVSFNESDVGETPTESPLMRQWAVLFNWTFPIRLQCCAQFHDRCGRGGVVFPGRYWVPVLAHLAKLPLWFATASLIDKTMRTSANHEVGMGITTHS